jgi:N-acetyl-gamma-glutamyl-phosphate reductase
MIKTAIVGASGYTGGELVRLLNDHPEVELIAATSRQYADMKVADVFPNLDPELKLKFTGTTDDIIDSQAEIVFCGLPHGVSMDIVPKLLDAGKKVIDLSADYRFHDRELYQKHYGDHSSPLFLKEAAYGLPELYRHEIRAARLVATPGCYPTSAILAMAPLMSKQLTKSVIIDSKSGTSGAGRGANQAMLYGEVSEDFRAYKIGSHRHTPEIVDQLSKIAERDIDVVFTPHLLPLTRGILSSCYFDLNGQVSTEEAYDLYQQHYANEPFIRVLEPGQFPRLASVQGTNICAIGLHMDEEKKRGIVISCIDNLVKGASGAAVQCFNILTGIDETLGLNRTPLFP